MRKIPTSINKCTVQRFIEQKQHTQKISEPLFEMFTLLSGFLSRRVGLGNSSLEVEGKLSTNLIQRLTFTRQSSNAICLIADFWSVF